MDSLLDIEILPADPADLAEVRSFYQSVGYLADLADRDRLLVARSGPTIVAAVRLSREFEVLVLRGMYVAEPLRGRGVGSRLLVRAAKEIGVSVCWCIPYVHLVEFYGRIGFRVVVDDEVPGFLAARRERYLARGREVAVMRRPGSGG